MKSKRDTNCQKYQIGKGKKMSIAKAALIVYADNNIDAFDVGCPDPLHKIIDVAEAKHVSFLTPCQVIARLRNSPYFSKKIIYGMYSGIRGNWRTALLKPSPKGEQFIKNIKSHNKT